VDEWRRQVEDHLARAGALLAPTVRTLGAQPFLFGDAPTLADAALYGQFAMLHAADPALLARFAPAFRGWIARLERQMPRRPRSPLAA
jgi:glutathione S-transferase